MRARFVLAVVGALWVSVVSAQEIYRYVDHNGNVIFTDRPMENAEKIDVREPDTISLPPADAVPFTPPDEEEYAAFSYTRAVITKPADDAVVFNNSGEVHVQIELEPALRNFHTITLMLDGKPVQEGVQQGSFVLSNIDRGTHNLAFTVKDAEGKELIRSADSTFHMRRTVVR